MSLESQLNSSQQPNLQYQFNFKTKGLHVTNLNIRHLKPKMDELRIMLDVSNCVDIFGVCEAFLNKSIDDNTVHVDGYNFERKDRQENPLCVDSKDGGVLIYLADHINNPRRQDIESEDIESI